jgi:hypothetical protein
MLIDHLPEDREWADEGDIAFDLPEHVAWEIQRLAEEEDSFSLVLCRNPGPSCVVSMGRSSDHDESG